MELGELGFHLPLTGFSGAELGKLIPRVEQDAAAYIPPVPAEPVTRAGDLWILGEHRIICGDSTDPDTVAQLLAGEKPHLMVTNPPYGVEYDPEWRNRAGVSTTERTGRVENDHRADWREAWALFPGEVAYVWHAGIYATTVAEPSCIRFYSALADHLGQATAGAKPRHYHPQHEPCWYALREGGQGHWQGTRDHTTSHSTRKPVECMSQAIQNNSKPGEAVYEPFSGSGTTIIAAELENRRCYAVELSPEYIDVAVLR